MFSHTDEYTPHIKQVRGSLTNRSFCQFHEPISCMDDYKKNAYMVLLLPDARHIAFEQTLKSFLRHAYRTPVVLLHMDFYLIRRGSDE